MFISFDMTLYIEFSDVGAGRIVKIMRNRATKLLQVDEYELNPSGQGILRSQDKDIGFIIEILK